MPDIDLRLDENEQFVVKHALNVLGAMGWAAGTGASIACQQILDQMAAKLKDNG